MGHKTPYKQEKGPTHPLPVDRGDCWLLRSARKTIASGTLYAGGEGLCAESGADRTADLRIDLPHGAVARLCTRRLLLPHSKKPFTEGFMPDIEILLSAEDYITSDDKALNRAIEHIRQQ